MRSPFADRERDRLEQRQEHREFYHVGGRRVDDQRAGDVLLSLHLSEGRRAVLAVQGQAGPGNLGCPLAFRRGCGHQLILTGNGRTPRTPVRARVPLLPSGPGGVGGINAVRGVRGQCSQLADQMFRNPVTGGFG